MESIQRSLMMLKPDGTHYADHKYQAALKLQALPEGLLAELTALPLPEGSYALYLFETDGRAHRAGGLDNMRLNVTVPSLTIQKVAGAAVIHEPNLEFVLKSSGLNWAPIMAQFKFARKAKEKKEVVPEEVPRYNELVREEIPRYNEPVPEEMPGYNEQVSEPDIQNDEVQETGQADAPMFGEAPEVCDSCPHVIRQERINPFPSVFPDSEWVKVSYPGPTGWWHYISGSIRNQDTVVAKVLGVPGEYGMAPPIWLEGFGTYMRCVTPDARGYWLMFQDAETGEVLDMGLSQHGG